MMHDEVSNARKLVSKCRGNPPPPLSSHPPKTKGGRRNTTYKTLREKRRVGNTHEHLGTCLNSDVTSATTPIAIEGVKYGDGKVNLACRSVNIEGENGGKEKGTAPADHTTAPAHSACLAVNACCKCGPTLTCKTARCECRKDARVCVSCRCLERCVNPAPQTRQEETRSKGDMEGKGEEKCKRRQIKEKEGQPAHQTPRARLGKATKANGKGKSDGNT